MAGGRGAGVLVESRRLISGALLPIPQVMLSPGLVAEVGPIWWPRSWVGGIAAFVIVGAMPISGIDVPVARGVVVLAAGFLALVLAAPQAHRAHAAGIAEAAAHAGLAFALGLFGVGHGAITLLHGSADGAPTLASQIGLPMAALALVCIADPSSPTGHLLAQGWRPLLVGHSVACVAVVAALVSTSGWLDPAAPRTAGALVAAVCASSVALVVSRSRVRLAARLDDPTVLAGALALTGLGVTAVVAVAPWSSDLTAWTHDVVFAAAMIGVARASGAGIDRDPLVAELLAPIDAAVPGCSVELAADPSLARLLAISVDGDRQVGGHLRRTCLLAVAVASELDLDPATIRRSGLGALLHDAGKSPEDRALLRSDALSPSQVDAVRGHAARGAAMVAGSPMLAEIVPIVRAHHERIDGAGWPDGLVGSDIPIEARIVAVCDSYDAILASPAFGPDAPRTVLLAILREHGNRQWDRACVDALARVVRRHPDERLPGTRQGWCCPDAVPGALGIRRLGHAVAEADEASR